LHPISTSPWSPIRLTGSHAGSVALAPVFSTRSEMKDFEPSNPFKKQPQNRGAAPPPR
jgi:hypothetical protein